MRQISIPPAHVRLLTERIFGENLPVALQWLRLALLVDSLDSELVLLTLLKTGNIRLRLVGRSAGYPLTCGGSTIINQESYR